MITFIVAFGLGFAASHYWSTIVSYVKDLT